MTAPAVVTMRVAKPEISTNGSNWTDWSGYSNQVAIGGGDRELSEEFIFNEDVGVLSPGKRGHIELTLDVVYTEGGAEPFEVARAAYEAGTPFYMRFSPKGGGSTQFLFTSDSGYITKAPYIGGAASGGKAMVFQVVLATPKLTKSVIA